VGGRDTRHGDTRAVKGITLDGTTMGHALLGLLAGTDALLDGGQPAQGSALGALLERSHIPRSTELYQVTDRGYGVTCPNEVKSDEGRMANHQKVKEKLKHNILCNGSGCYRCWIDTDMIQTLDLQHDVTIIT